MDTVFSIPSESDMQVFAEKLAANNPRGFCCYLQGELGAGKTTLVRAFLRSLGVTSVIKSPTYTLMEEYTLQDYSVFHLDLYRLSEPEELEYLGLQDVLGEQDICFIEWPKNGQGFLPAADIECYIEHCDGSVIDGRELRIKTERQDLIKAIQSCQ